MAAELRPSAIRRLISKFGPVVFLAAFVGGMFALIIVQYDSTPGQVARSSGAEEVEVASAAPPLPIPEIRVLGRTTPAASLAEARFSIGRRTVGFIKISGTVNAKG